MEIIQTHKSQKDRLGEAAPFVVAWVLFYIVTF